MRINVVWNDRGVERIGKRNELTHNGNGHGLQSTE